MKKPDAPVSIDWEMRMPPVDEFMKRVKRDEEVREPESKFENVSERLDFEEKNVRK